MMSLILNLMAVAVGIVAIRKWRDAGYTSTQIPAKLGLTREFLIPDSACGLATGVMAVSIALFVLCLVTASTTNWHFSANLGIALRTMTILGMAFAEELAFRSFAFAGIYFLTRSVILAVSIPSVLFGLAHVGVDHASLTSVLSTVLGGLMYALPVWLWGRLNFSIAMHFAWNLTQACLFGLPMSGKEYESILNFTLQGPDWLTGGAYGIEGGVSGIVARFLVIATILLLWRFRIILPTNGMQHHQTMLPESPSMSTLYNSIKATDR